MLMLLAVVGLVAGGASAPPTQATSAETLALYISFFANGTITVTLPNGDGLGATSGQPPEIPAGFYSLFFSGPGGCSAVPYFHLNGPSINIATDMSESSQAKIVDTANLLPSSTYTWTDDAFPGVDHAFTTSAVVEGSPPAPTVSPPSTASGGKGVTYPSIVGSEAVPFRGTLTATLNAAAKLSIAYKGKRPTALESGKYTISVRDQSSRGGLTIEHAGHAAITISSADFTGERTRSVNLVAGTWLFASGKSRAQYTVLVS